MNLHLAEKVAQLQGMISAASKIVFFGGAGVSTESGIPDFRSADGLYSQKFAYPPEYMLSHTFFATHTQEFFEFYRAKMLPPASINPNAAHIFLAWLENCGKLTAIITQNIDGLHQAAGSKNVLELHGSVWRNYCTKCGKFYKTGTDGGIAGIVSGGAGVDKDSGMAAVEVPKCGCSGIIKPDVVLYEESLHPKTLQKAVEAVSQADLLIIGGTSLNVYPAAGLVNYLGGSAKLVIINKAATHHDKNADLLISEFGIAQVFSALNLN